MIAKELFAAGQLDAAIAQLNLDAQADPGNYSLRTFLCGLLCFAGNYDRAERQLSILEEESEEARTGVAEYREAIAAERQRKLFFDAGQRPELLLGQPIYADAYLQGVDLVRAGSHAEAKELLSRAAAVSPKIKASINGYSCSNLRDIDDRFGPFLEVHVHGLYTWIAMEQLTRLRLVPPTTLRDLLWAPALLEAGDTAIQVLLPVLYPGSAQHPGEQVRLGRMTDWRDNDAGLTLGIGQRIFVADDCEVAALEVRDVRFETASR